MSRVLATKLGQIPEPIVTPETINAAKAAWAAHRQAHGLSAVAVPLLTAPDENTKIKKSEVPTYSLSLAQATTSGYNVCPSSTPECRKHCVSTSGKGAFDRVQRARQVRTTFLADMPNAFVTLLVHELDRALARHGEIHARLNTFSDLPWETVTPWLFARFPAVRFYDYTKDWSRCRYDLPSNYHLTYSVSERTDAVDALIRTQLDHNVAVVVKVRRTEPMPTTIELRTKDGNVVVMPCIDGDATDDRTTDPIGVVVGLRPKGSMRKGSTMIRA